MEPITKGKDVLNLSYGPKWVSIAFKVHVSKAWFDMGYDEFPEF